MPKLALSNRSLQDLEKSWDSGVMIPLNLLKADQTWSNMVPHKSNPHFVTNVYDLGSSVHPITTLINSHTKEVPENLPQVLLGKLGHKREIHDQVYFKLILNLEKLFKFKPEWKDKIYNYALGIYAPLRDAIWMGTYSGPSLVKSPLLRKGLRKTKTALRLPPYIEEL